MRRSAGRRMPRLVERGVPMKRLALVFCSTLVLALAIALAAGVAPKRVPNVTDSTGAMTLPNGWRITPAGHHVKLPGDLPMKIERINGSEFLILTAGYHDHSLSVVNAKTREVTATLDVVKAWDGMAFDPKSGLIYLSGGGLPKRNFANVLARMTSPMKSDIDKPILRVKL